MLRDQQAYTISDFVFNDANDIMHQGCRLLLVMPPFLSMNSFSLGQMQVAKLHSVLCVLQWWLDFGAEHRHDVPSIVTIL